MMQNSSNDEQKNIQIIGITGGVGSGKSSVLSFLKEKYSCKVIQADTVANDLKDPGKVCYRPTIDLLGKEVLTSDGKIDNKKMAKKIFSSPKLLEQINECIHPEVKEEIKRNIKEENDKNEIDFLFIEAALLIDAGYLDIVDSCWFIYTDDEIRISRLKTSRNYSDEKISDIMSKQLSNSEFEKACDVIINNSGSWSETEKQIVDIMEEYSWEKK